MSETRVTSEKQVKPAIAQQTPISKGRRRALKQYWPQQEYLSIRHLSVIYSSMVYELLKDFIMEKYRRRWLLRTGWLRSYSGDWEVTVLNCKDIVTLSGQVQVHIFPPLTSENRRLIKRRNQLNFEVYHTRFR